MWATYCKFCVALVVLSLLYYPAIALGFCVRQYDALHAYTNDLFDKIIEGLL